ncbi:MAG: transcriptional regulator, partial [Betaproteobacteria bacterium RIFCSPLOWO2_12_FULL_62_13]
MKFITINPRDALPLTVQITEELRKRIVQRALRPGTRLPSIRSFAKAHGVSTFTVVEAYDRLVNEGFLVSRKGSGFYISARARTNHARERINLENAEDTLWILRSILQERRPVLKPGAGWLPASWLDERLIRNSLRSLARKPAPFIVEYGWPHGYLPLREQLVDRLIGFGISVQPHQLITTHGVSQAIDLVGRYFVHPGDTVLVDDPGYYAIFGYLKTLGARLVGVPRTQQGPDLAALERIIEEHQPKLFFTMTVLHNPTGTSTNPAIAHGLLQLAKKYEFMIVENDTYGDFHPNPLTRLATLDQLNRVIYVSGFSKTVSPDLRVGYIACREDLLEDLVDLKVLTGLTTSQLNEKLILNILASGQYQKHLQNLRERLEQNREITIRKLENCGLEIFAKPEAGIFVLARFNSLSNTAEITSLAATKGIILGPGHLFRPHHEPSPWLRFNVAFCDDPLIYRFLRSV